jgi:hypothetical protein
MKNKKASVESWMVFVAVILITLIILAIFIKDWGTTMNREQRIQTCKRSVQFRGIEERLDIIQDQLESPTSILNEAINTGIRGVTGVVAYVATGVVASAVITATGGAATPLVIAGISTLAAGGSAFFLAPTSDTILVGDSTDIKLNCFTEEKNIKKESQQAIISEIADEMYTCYDMFGRNNYENIFGPDGKSYCFICSIVSFKEDLEIPQTDVINYLAEHSPKGQDLTYADIFAGCDYRGCSSESEEEIEIDNPMEETYFDLSEDHVVLYVAHDFNNNHKTFSVFMPYTFQKMRHVCDYVYMGKE